MRLLARLYSSVFPRAAAERFAARNTTVTSDRNPWKEPPADVMEEGMPNVAAYLRDLDDYGRAWSYRLKVVLVGLGEAGKTSIATRLENRFGSGCPNPEERTVGVEIRNIKLGPGIASEGDERNTKLDVSLWEFAGQRAYYDTHQMFLTPDALFVLVVDTFAYSEDHSREDALEQWLDILQGRVPGSVVFLVGTHTDLFEGNAVKRAERTECFMTGREEARSDGNYDGPCVWCLSGKKKGKGVATRKLRLFFLCPYDMSLAECGPGGQGYEVTELLQWAKEAKPLAKVGLALASIAFTVCTGLTTREVNSGATLGATAGGALFTLVGESLNMGGEASASVTEEKLDGGRPEGLLNHGAQQGWPSPVQGFAYETLKEVIKSFEVDGMRGRSPFPSFDGKMNLVDRGGRGAEWAWVRNVNIDHFVSA